MAVAARTPCQGRSAESGLNKLFSTAEPLSTLLHLAATWAHLHMQFQVEHLAGKKKSWADAMSRGRIAFVQHRGRDRVRIDVAQLASASHCVTLHGSARTGPHARTEPPLPCSIKKSVQSLMHFVALHAHACRVRTALLTYLGAA